MDKSSYETALSKFRSVIPGSVDVRIRESREKDGIEIWLICGAAAICEKVEHGWIEERLNTTLTTYAKLYYEKLARECGLKLLEDTDEYLFIGGPLDGKYQKVDEGVEEVRFPKKLQGPESVVEFDEFYYRRVDAKPYRIFLLQRKTQFYG